MQGKKLTKRETVSYNMAILKHADELKDKSLEELKAMFQQKCFPSRREAIVLLVKEKLFAEQITKNEIDNTN